MTSYEEEFLSTGQEARRLSIALLRFIQIDDPEWKNKYQKYLSLRFRPALSTLIRDCRIYNDNLSSKFLEIGRAHV